MASKEPLLQGSSKLLNTEVSFDVENKFYLDFIQCTEFLSLLFFYYL